MYQQVLDPVGGSLGLTSIFAVLPLLTLFVLLGALRMPAQWASLISLVVAIVVALAVYSMPLGQTLDAAAWGAAFGLFPIMWIVVNAIWIYQMTVATGHFQVLRRSFASISDDQRIQAIIIAFCFGALIEALAGLRHAGGDHRGDAHRAGPPAAQGGGGGPGGQHGAGRLRGDRDADHHARRGDRQIPPDTLGAIVGRQTPVLALIVPLILVGMVDGRARRPPDLAGRVVGGVSLRGRPVRRARTTSRSS